MLKIAITGHRNLLNEKEVRENIALSLQYFQKIDTDLQAISALAVGADQIKYSCTLYFAF
jgi:ABC-type methionine transport system ATPase subunit